MIVEAEQRARAVTSGSGRSGVGLLICVGAQSIVRDLRVSRTVFGLACRIIDDPEAHTPLVIPRSR